MPRLLRAACRWQTFEPHNHSLGRLWRFRDGRLEMEYQRHCQQWKAKVLLAHTSVMAAVYAFSTSSYMGAHFTMAGWLSVACGAASLTVALLLLFTTTAKRHTVSIYAAYCFGTVSVQCALIQVLYTDFMAQAAATWPKGLSPAEQQTLAGYAEWLIGYHCFLNQLLAVITQWFLLASAGLSVSTISSFTCSLVAFCACTAATPHQTVFDTLKSVMYVVIGSMGILLVCLLLERLHRASFLAHTQLAQELRASQMADSILNHTLKNILADVAANLELFLAGVGETALLVDGIACLRRGMQHCRERQVYLKLAAGEYQPTPTPVHLPGLAHQLVAGRPIAVQVPDLEVLLDATLMALILENAISNAVRHGSPENPDVRFEITEFFPEASETDLSDLYPLRHLQFIISNAAHPQRPPLTPEDVHKLFHGNGVLQPEAADPVSFHVGLTHCLLAAKCGGIQLELRQEDDRVLFVASLAAREAPAAGEGPWAESLGRAASGCPVLPSATVLPAGLCFCCIDDSPAAQRLLAHHIQRSFPAVTVHCFGASEADVAGFLATALAEADIVILDQHLECKDEMKYGTNLVQQLVAAGYGGLVCIRSANDSPEDRAYYAACGAHCVLGKDVLGARMVEELAAAHAKHVALGGAPVPGGSLRNPAVPRPASSSAASSPLPSPLSPARAVWPWLAGGPGDPAKRMANFELHSVVQSPASPSSAEPPGGDFSTRRPSLPGEVPQWSRA
eukprot:EG_transcript_3301